MLECQNPAQTMTLKKKPSRIQRDPIQTKGSKPTVARGEAFNPQHNVQQKNDNERCVKNIPHLSYTGSECASIAYGKTTNVREVHWIELRY